MSEKSLPKTPASNISQTPTTPNERLIEKLFESINDQILEEIEEEEFLVDNDWDISFDEVDERLSEFQEEAFVHEAFTKLCDQILETMEDMLSDFQMDLGKISNEIQTLQDKSFSMNIQLKNRTVLENSLNNILEGIIIPPPMVKKITEDEIDEIWLAYLTELNKKMSYVKQKQGKNIKALKDVGPELEKLRLKASEKIRDYLLSKIKSLRIPNTNVQILQQSILLKHKVLYQFVMQRYSDVAFEIMHTYMNTMRWYFSNHFERYMRGLQKLQSPIADKFAMIGYDENVRKGSLLFGTSKIALQDKINICALGDRIDTLKNQDSGVILVHVAEDKNQKHPYEVLFRSFNLTFIDNASSEYLFITEFFTKDEKPNVDLAKEIFAEIFEPTIRMGLNFTKQYIENSYDAIGVLLCIRLNTQFTLELQRRRVPALEAYTNQTNMLLWPKFQALMDLHIESIKKASNKLIVKDFLPHYVTRRFAEFSASLLILNEDYKDSNLTNTLLRLRSEVDLLLNKMSTTFEDKKSRLIFLINNYDLIITILSESGGKATEPEIIHFRELLNTNISGFVEEELQPYFGNLISFVKYIEQIDDTESINSVDMYDKISSEFIATWRQSIASINTSVIQYFSNFKNGTVILHTVLGQLIIYYTKFCNALEDGLKNGRVRVRQQPVGVQSVMVEIKKFKSNF
ncbi:8029_t:CDS:10 [Entrophospora sp. SA101]|nr:8029_t:CDS:10 [Entrophospora sp. SA101]